MDILYKKDRLFSVPQLKDRGWTDAAVKRFMPKEDDTRDNPIYSYAGAPMRFYLIRRVKRIERTKAWLEWREKSSTRRVAATQAVATKTADLMSHVATMDIEVPKIGDKELLDRSIQHYNDNHDSENRASTC